MNWKKFVLISCVVPCVFAIPTATAQMRRQRAPMLNSASGSQHWRDGRFDRDDRFRRFRRFTDGDFDRDDRFRRFHRFNDGDFDRDDRFRRFHRFNEVVVFDNFGFPFFPFFYPYPYCYHPYPYSYPYGNYPRGYDEYGTPSDYGKWSSVVLLQRRLAQAGYYHGAIDGIMGPATRRATRAYERTHNQSAYGMTDRY